MGINPFFKDGSRTERQQRNYVQYNRPQQNPARPPQQPPQQREGNYPELSRVTTKIKNLGKMSDLDPKDFADIDGDAAKIAQELKKGKGGIKTSQLRKFFDPLVKIESKLKKSNAWDKEIEGQLRMVLPTLAYAVGRELAPKEFYDLVDICVKKVLQGDPSEKIANFERFMDFLRSIVAYNKYYGGE